MGSQCIRVLVGTSREMMGSSSSRPQEKVVPQGPPSVPQAYYPPPAQQQGYGQPPQGYGPPSQGYGPPPQVYGAAPPSSMPMMGAYEAPPAYTARPQGSICSGPPGLAGSAYPRAPAGGYSVPAPAPQVGPVTGQFDAGARFSANNPPSIPPPPPGVAPTAVQQAAMQGGQVVMGQKEGGFLKGSGSGGYTFW